MSGTNPLRVVTVIGTAVATLAVAAMAPTSAAPSVAQGQAQGQAQKQAQGQAQKQAQNQARQPQGARTLVPAGLDNPRHLAFDRRGRLYVAEAGRGGTDPCITGLDGNSVCFGTTGAVSRIGPRGGHRRVASGFPSLSLGGDSAIGPTDILLGKRGRYFVTIGLGDNPNVRPELPQVGRRFMGTLTSGRFHRGRFVLADLAGYEAAANPDRGLRDSNPGGFIRRGRGFVVADAGGNDIVAVSRRGNVSAIRTFGTRRVPVPDSAGPPVDMQSVPTSVARGRKGVLFVSELTGFPFPAGRARIFRVVPGQRTQVFATGLTNVTDLTVYRGQLYAVQIADEGFLASGGVPSGSLVRVVPGGTPVTVADNLQAPYGVAIRRGKAYVTTCSVCAGRGGVVRIPLFR